MAESLLSLNYSSLPTRLKSNFVSRIISVVSPVLSPLLGMSQQLSTKLMLNWKISRKQQHGGNPAFTQKSLWKRIKKGTMYLKEFFI